MSHTSRLLLTICSSALCIAASNFHATTIDTYRNSYGYDDTYCHAHPKACTNAEGRAPVRRRDRRL